MKVIVNNKDHTIETGAGVSKLLDFIDVPEAYGLAIAVNNRIIPRSQWENHKLSEGDKILLVKAAQGG